MRKPVSAAGNVEGACAVEADVQHLRALRTARKARVAWSMPNRKSRRPCAMKTGRRDGAELRDARARGGPRPHRRRIPCEGRRLSRASSDGSRRVSRDRAREPGDEAGLHETLRHERGEEIGPRLDRDHRGPRHAGDERVEDRAAAVGDAPGADPRVGDVRPRGEPVVYRARVGDLARAVDPDEAAGLAVSARVEGEDGVALPVNP